MMASTASKHNHIVGTETEHDIRDTTGQVTKQTVTKAMPHRAARYGIARVGSLWGRNGCHAYGEVAEKVEWAGPECTTGHDAMVYEHAGSLFWALMALGADLDLGREPIAWILKTNSSHNGDSGGGNHINLSMPLRGLHYATAFGEAARFLKTFMVTFQIITGSGVVLPRQRADTLLGTPGYGYAISPRGFHVTKDSGYANTNTADGDKPIFLYRDEALADESRFWRLQISGLDSNILPSVLQFKLDLLLLMAEMVVAKAFKPLHIIEDSDTAHSMRRVSLNWRAPLRIARHGSLTPLEIQWRCFRQVENYIVNRRGGRGKALLEEWASLLKEFDTDDNIPAGLFGRVDWVTKAVLLEQRAKKLGSKFDYPRAEELHFAYHGFRFTTSGLCLPLRLIRRFGPPGIGRQIRRALHQPPTGTRAWCRGRYASLGISNAYASWEVIGVDGGRGIALPGDPSVPTTPQVEAFIKRYTT
jgi:hypothetical protein